MSQILSRCNEKVRLARSESVYHEKIFGIVTNLIDKFREPPAPDAESIDLMAEAKKLGV